MIPLKLAPRSIFRRGAERQSFSLPAVIAMMVLVAVGLLDARNCQAQLRIEAEAYSGVPFGVGRITLRPEGADIRLNRLPRPGARGGRIAEMAKRLIDQGGNRPRPTNLESAEMAISEKTGRALYPVFAKRDRPILSEFVSVPTETTVFFLFQGDTPLDLTLYAPEPHSGQVTPRKSQVEYDRMLRAWWNDYAPAAIGGSLSKEYPPLVQEYLTDTLARRLNLPLPKRLSTRESGLFQSELQLLLATESGRQEVAQSILLDDDAQQPLSELLPEVLPQPLATNASPPAAAIIEPIANHVPVECFYVRFGNFSNFLWLRHRLTDWGGEMRDIISERGLDYALNERFQQQLGLRESALAELLGERVIADVALIGTDTFLRDGAAMGLLFQAKSSTALAADLGQQRASAAQADKTARQEKLTILNHQVSLVSTPDNRLRSFYVADGDYHLVTTSRKIVEWFLAAGAGKHESLGGSHDFRNARLSMPLVRNDTVFIYLSPAFFENLFSPRYQIEIDRRLRAAVSIDLADIAQLAARAEQMQGDTIEQLTAAGLLPVRFGSQPDGSHLEASGTTFVDSLRGARGKFVPVPDMEFDKITRAEAVEYRRFADYFTAQWGPMDPLVAAIQRQALPGGKLERVVVDFRAAPLSQKHIDLLSKWLGPATDQRLAPVPGDIVAFEAVMRGGSFFANGDHHLFGALRDADPAIALDPRAGLIARLFTSRLNGLQGYMGAWPNPGFLKFFAGLTDIQPDQAGYARLLTGLWRRQFEQFTLLSFHPEILAQASPELHFVKAERPAQIWFHAEDLANSKLAPMLNAYGYRQSRQMTLANTRFMNLLEEQLHVPPADCRKVAEELLGAKFENPLGGKYELRQWSGGFQAWVDTALADRPDSSQPPAEYQLPALNWLRGIDFELSANQGSLVAHAEVIMPVETKPAFQLPTLPTLPFGAGKLNSKPAKPAPKKPGPSDVDASDENRP